ncbi:MAG: hypothetical protein ACRD7E_15205, partial [Bryobacteraceae bacterium]
QQAVREIGENLGPSLICVYGEPNRIDVASKGSLLGIGLNSFGSLAGFAGTRAGPSSYDK